MKSGRQRRDEIAAKRRQRRARAWDSPAGQSPQKPSMPLVPVNEDLLAPYNSYGAPDFVVRGYYLDCPFRCVACGSEHTWTGTQQKWWYEVAKGYPYSTAKLCRPCRRREQARRAEARRLHLEGLARRKKSKT